MRRFLCGLVVAAVTSSAEVVVEGIEPVLSDNVRVHLSLEDLSCDAPSWLVRWSYQNAKAETQRALEVFGYYEVRVASDLVIPDEGCWTATLDVVLGEPVRVARTRLDVLGSLSEEPQLETARAALAGLEGERLHHGDYETVKQRLFDVADRLGYFDAKLIENRVTVDPAAGRAEIDLALDGGPRYRFGELTINGDVLDEDVVGKFATLDPGQFYDREQVAELRRHLVGSNYFNEVTVQARREQAHDQRVPVTIDLTPPSRNWAYSLGVGYATDTGPRLRGEAADRLRNARGHRARTQFLLSKILSSLSLTYEIPHKSPIDDWFSFDAGYAREDSKVAESEIQRLGARHTHAWGQWIQSDFIDLSFENFEIATDDDQSRLIVIGTDLSRSERNDPVRPRRGYRVAFNLRGTDEAIGSNASFVQGRVTAKVVRPLTERTRVLIRGEIGATGTDDFSKLPPSVRFFAGGDNSVRGYGYEELGPEEDGDVIGARNLITGSVEFDFAFRERWSAALFIDSGSAFDGSDPEFSTGAGFGLRWYSPLGPFRLDLAQPLNSGRAVRVHVSIGPDL